MLATGPPQSLRPVGVLRRGAFCCARKPRRAIRPRPQWHVFLELKKKCKSVVCKRRVTVSQSYEGLEGSTVTIMGGPGAARPDGMGFSPDQRQALQKMG